MERERGQNANKRKKASWSPKGNFDRGERRRGNVFREEKKIADKRFISCPPRPCRQEG